MTGPVHHVGASTVQKIFETPMDSMTLKRLLPDLDEEALKDHPDWIPADTMDAQGHALMSIHVWLVRHDGRVILIDTGAGDDKRRPDAPDLNHLSTSFLARLTDADVAPDSVDLIIHTHIHPDHVGWNTRLVDGEWTPTFPHAEVVVSDLEFAYSAAIATGDDRLVDAAIRRAGLGDPVRRPPAAPFLDSIVPLAGRVPLRRVATEGAEIAPGIRYVPTPGHSIDHASIELTSAGETALFSGDVLHHPVEVRVPDVVTSFCEFPDAARQSRRRFLIHAARTRAAVFTSHFSGASAGRVEADGGGWRWTFME